MKKQFLKLLTFTLFAFLFIGNVSASKIAEADDNYIQEGEYNSVRFAAGNNFTNKATIDGISFGAGNIVIAEGNVSYGFYAGNVVTINEKVEKDLFVAGNSITIGSDAELSRDVFIAGNNVVIYGNVPRDLRVGASTVVIKGVTIGGDVYIDAEKITLDESTVIEGKLSYPSTAVVSNADKASIGSIEEREVQEIDEEAVESAITAFAVGTFVVFLIAAMVTLLILLGVLPTLREKLEKVPFNASAIAQTSGIGFLVLIAVPIISMLTLFTGILTPLTLIVLAIYAICIYLASLFAAYVIGCQIFKALFKKKNYSLSILLGVLVVRLVVFIPLLGGLIEFIVLIYGLGITYNAIKANMKKK